MSAVDIEAVDVTVGFELDEAQDDAVPLRDVGLLLGQSGTPMGIVGRRRRPGLELIRGIAQTDERMNGAMEEIGDLVRIGRSIVANQDLLQDRRRRPTHPSPISPRPESRATLASGVTTRLTELVTSTWLTVTKSWDVLSTG